MKAFAFVLPLLSVLSTTLASQTPMVSPEELAKFSESGGYHPESFNLPTIGDVLTGQMRSSIFYDYLRDIRSYATMVNNRNAKPMTMFVPTNRAVISLPQKP